MVLWSYGPFEERLYFYSLMSHIILQVFGDDMVLSQINQKVHFIGKYSFAIYLYNGTLGTFVAHLGAVL